MINSGIPSTSLLSPHDMISLEIDSFIQMQSQIYNPTSCLPAACMPEENRCQSRSAMAVAFLLPCILSILPVLLQVLLQTDLSSVFQNHKLAASATYCLLASVFASLSVTLCGLISVLFPSMRSGCIWRFSMLVSVAIALMGTVLALSLRAIDIM